jgi:PAS domain S-box-containing protein
MSNDRMVDEIDETMFLRQRVQVQAEILNHLPNGVLVVDAASRILMVNNPLCLFTGYEEEELRFKNLSMLLPEKYRGNHAEYVKKFSSHPDAPPRYMGGSATLFPLLKKDGSTAPVDIAISHVTSHAGKLCVAVIRWELPR